MDKDWRLRPAPGGRFRIQTGLGVTRVEVLRVETSHVLVEHAARAGTPPEDRTREWLPLGLWRHPFVTVWPDRDAP